MDGPTIVGLQLQNPSLPYNAASNPLVAVFQLLRPALSGGRIIQITPQGVVSDFAQGFDVSSAAGSSSFIDSELSISFSADGTTLWASDDQGIWQFKTTASLADSTSGTLIGLNDLRTLGVPYDGEGSAVAVVDTGVDGQTRRSAAASRPARTSGPGVQATKTSLQAASATTTGGRRGRSGRRGRRALAGAAPAGPAPPVRSLSTRSTATVRR